MSGNFEIRRRPLEEGDGEMSASAERSEGTNPKTGMTHREMKEFIRNHFEEFVNRNNLLEGPAVAIQCVGAGLKKVPDLRVSIEDLIVEDDRVVVRNHWTGTDRASKQLLEFSGMVIWRIADRQIVERGAYLQSPGFVRS